VIDVPEDDWTDLDDRDEFADCGGCTCFVSAPCHHCTEHLDEDAEPMCGARA
jgi:hypothetical protein